MSLFGLVMTAATAYDVIVVRWMNGNTKEISKYEVWHLTLFRNFRTTNLQKGQIFSTIQYSRQSYENIPSI